MSEIELQYEGKPWKAKNLENSKCHIRMYQVTKPSNGMCWSAPTVEMSEICWKAIHHPESVTKNDMMLMASVIDSYRSLLNRPQREQAKLMSAIRKCMEIRTTPAPREE